MAFDKSEVAQLLTKCHRRCCVCHKFCGVKAEVHHIRWKSKGGSDDIENAIFLCFECHAEVNHYNPEHPKGRKFTEEELLGHKQQWLKICKESPETLINAPQNKDVGPLEGMVQELEFNIAVVREVNTTDGSGARKMGCPLRSIQFERAITEGTLMLLSEDLKHKLNQAYARVGKVNTFINLLANTRPEGNAFAEAQNRLHATIIESELPIGETLGSLKQFLSTDRDS